VTELLGESLVDHPQDRQVSLQVTALGGPVKGMALGLYGRRALFGLDLAAVKTLEEGIDFVLRKDLIHNRWFSPGFTSEPLSSD
jgi:hypothetical protein